MTIILGAAADFAEVETIVAKARKDLRNLVDSCRRKDSRWDGFALHAHLEVDAISPDDMPLLGTERSALLGNLTVGVNANPIWIPSLHGVIRFDGLDWQQVMSELQRKWPIERQAHLARFRDRLDVSKNGGNAIDYSLKHHCISKFGHVSDPWPISWMISYYEWLAGWTYFLRRTRFKIGKRDFSKKARSDPELNIKREDNKCDDHMANDFSVLPSLYITGRYEH